MRFRVIAASFLLIAVSAGSVKTLAASPDCARWIRDYQQGLAKRASVAKKRVVHAAKGLGIPRPHRVRTGVPPGRLHAVKLSPQEMLKRFRVLCGDDLPDEPIAMTFVPTSLDAMLVPPVIVNDYVPVGELGRPVTFAPETPVSTTPVASQPTPGTVFPGVPVVTNPAPPIVPIDIAPVPEPGSLLLLTTGVLGMVPLVRRRFR